MYLSKKRIQELLDSYMFSSLVDDDEIAGIFEFVADVFEFEADLIKEKEPYAVNTIERYREIQREVRSLGANVDETMTEE